MCLSGTTVEYAAAAGWTYEKTRKKIFSKGQKLLLLGVCQSVVLNLARFGDL